MKTPNKHRIPIILAFCAFFTALGALLSFNYSAFLYQLSLPALILVPLIAAANTFLFSALGIHLLFNRNFSPAFAALCGFCLGLAAFLCVFLPTLFLTFRPSFYQHVVFRLIKLAFLSGGFLAPVFGAIIGYWMAKRRG